MIPYLQLQEHYKCDLFSENNRQQVLPQAPAEPQPQPRQDTNVSIAKDKLQPPSIITLLYRHSSNK